MGRGVVVERHHTEAKSMMGMPGPHRSDTDQGRWAETGRTGKPRCRSGWGCVQRSAMRCICVCTVAQFWSWRGSESQCSVWRESEE